MMKMGAALLAFAAGVATAMQATMNAGLARSTGIGPALVINTIVVLIGVTGLWIALGAKTTFFPPGATWPLYLGGIFGFTIIGSLTFVFPRIGAAYAVVLMIGGQCVAALVVDHVGFLGMPATPVTLQRVLGVAMVAAGAMIVRGN